MSVRGEAGSLVVDVGLDVAFKLYQRTLVLDVAAMCSTLHDYEIFSSWSSGAAHTDPVDNCRAAK